MNNNFKTILLTIATLSFFSIALIEISGVSTKAIFNKYQKQNVADKNEMSEAQKMLRERFKADSIKLAKNRQLPKTTIKFYKTGFDFGKIKEGDSVTTSYTFTNTGSNPLMIVNVQVSCGCTVPYFPKEPILPNKQGKIDIVFHSKNKQGIQHKQLYVIANTDPESTVLHFDANVLPH